MNLSTEIVIVGGGIVGAVTAALLAPQVRQLVVLESTAMTSEPEEGLYPWVNALTPFTIHLLQQLGVWETLPPQYRTPYERMVVWEKAGATITFDAATVGEPYLGAIVPNIVLKNHLWQYLKTLPNVSLLNADTGLSLQSQPPLLTTQAGHTLKASLIIGADGVHSWVRQQAGLSTTFHDYGQSALIAVVATEEPHQHTAWQVFLPTGPLAFLPLTGPEGSSHHSAIVWTLPTEQAKELLQQSDLAFEQSCARAFDYQLGKVTLQSPRSLFPLLRHHVKHYVKEGLALVGDAAHTLHPLAGQGINLGIYDSLALSQVIANAQKKQRSFASHYTLRAYERQRKVYNSQMLLTVDTLKNLFASKSLGWLRSQGLRWLEQQPWLKQPIIQYASGGRG